MSKTSQLMADAKFYESYARYDDTIGKYETWEEAVSRVMNMHREKYTEVMTEELEELIQFAQDAYTDKLILGAQRALQFGGKQLLAKNAKMYNCTATYLDRSEFFKEAFWLMLCGCGIGFSVQQHHIVKLPAIKPRTKSAKAFIVEDSIEGWADAVGALMSSFFDEKSEYAGHKMYFDTTNIRPKGAEISGGFKAPGPEPLDKALKLIEKLIKAELDKGETKLRPIVAYDITMHIADAVISGGVRRAATICLFSHDDVDMITAKTGDWFVSNPQRGRSNNSAVLLRDSTQFEEFKDIMHSVQHSGEPGFVWTDDLDILFNPCVEVGMYAYTNDGRSGWQMCNLTEENGSMSTTLEIFLRQCKAASILGTLQAGYTTFSYLSPATKEIVDREALIGVGITGWMNNPDVLFDKEHQKLGAEEVKKWNKIVAELININQAARTTVVKPSGNASVLLQCASGIHGEHSKRYIRHVQMNKETEVAKLFLESNPNMVENSVWTHLDYVIGFPIEPKEGSIYKYDLLGIKQLEYVKNAQENWIEHGTNKHLCVKPFLKHNVSNTITVDDWDEVTKYIFDNRHSLCGISLLSASGDKAYPQAPFTEVLTEQQIISNYGEIAMFASGLIDRGLNAFNNDLWTACNTALGFGEILTDSHKDFDKHAFIRSFNKFSENFQSVTLTEEDWNTYNTLIDNIKYYTTTIEDLHDSLNGLLNVVDVLEAKSNSKNGAALTEVHLLVTATNTEIEEAKRELEKVNNKLNNSAVHISKQKSKSKCSDCLKDVYNLHKWWKINSTTKEINWATDLGKKEFVDVDTLGSQGCAGGACEVVF